MTERTAVAVTEPVAEPAGPAPAPRTGTAGLLLLTAGFPLSALGFTEAYRAAGQNTTNPDFSPTGHALFWLAIAIALGWFLLTNALREYASPDYHSQAVMASPVASLQDVGGFLFGMHRLAADVAWIQTLQYYGTFEEGTEEEVQENGGGRYPLLYAYCERVALLDPHFTYVYYFGGAALAWNLNRYDEAEKLLKLGIKNNPSEWRLTQYLAALAYQKNHDVSQLIVFLSSFINEPDCPNLLRSLLANLYKKEHRYAEAIAVWRIFAENGNQSDVHRARVEIDQINALTSGAQGHTSFLH